MAVYINLRDVRQVHQVHRLLYLLVLQGHRLYPRLRRVLYDQALPGVRGDQDRRVLRQVQWLPSGQVGL